MYLHNDKWEVDISEVNYNPDSADNTVIPDAYIVICDDYTKQLLLNITDTGYANEKKIVLSVSFFTPHDDFAFLDENKLILFLNDTVWEYNIQTEKVRKKEIDLTGTLFSVYRYHDDFILYGETDIIKMNAELDVLWDFMARDIFVRYHGEEPAFEMMPDRIRLYDFSDNYYETDYEGKVIRD